ncbi:MAG: hypothetical protein IKE43_11765 [Coriobacteriales bacterium]|nr:hypothetical protein [Coriobacteriales bacterium]
MKALLLADFKRAWCSRLTRISFVIALGLGIAAACIQISAYLNTIDYVVSHLDMKVAMPYSNSAYGNWIVIRMLQAIPNLFFFIAPFLIGLANSASLRTEIDNGYAQQILTRTSRPQYYLSKFLVTFILGGLIVALPLAVNFIMCANFIPAYQPEPQDITALGMNDSVILSEMFFRYPLAYVVVKTLLDFVLAGFWAVALLGLSLLIKNRVTLLCASYIALVAIKLFSERTYVLFKINGPCLTLMDLLRKHGDVNNPSWEVIIINIVICAILSLLIPYLMRKRDVL